MQRYKDLHSFLSFDPREGNEPGERIGNLLCGGITRSYFRGMQVLDLERVFRPELPSDIGRLKKLRYLGLRWTYIQSIPSSIGELVHLETLDLKHTYVRALPRSVWKLQRLRHLYLNQSNQSEFMRHQSGSFLESLETLWDVFVDKISPLKYCLDKLINLRKLGLSFQLDVPEERELLADRIVKMKHLQHLRLRSKDEMGGPCMLFLKLSGLEHLSILDLFGRLENPSVVAEFPRNLTELTLSTSGLSDDPMPVLETLSNLRLLSFYSKSYIGTRMVCSGAGFPQLLVLRFWKLEQLEEWKVSEESLRNLRELEIRSCEKLSIPNGLRNMKMLLELKLTNMLEAFVANVQNNQREIWGDVAHSPTITVNW